MQLSYVVAPCRHALGRRGIEAVRTTIRELALERFHGKQALFEGELAVFEAEQALYAGLLEALGYSRNRAPFRQLSRIVPPAAARCARTKTAIHELLLAGAGLVANGTDALRDAGLSGEMIAPEAWQVVGVRPENLPARRIAQAAGLLTRLLPGSLLEELLDPLAALDDTAIEAEHGRGLRARWRELLVELGPQRADAVAINVLLPFAAAYGQATCHFGLSDAATAAFLAFPPEGSNQVTRYMRREVLRGSVAAADGAAGEQGLLRVWDRWCHHKVCALCPLGSRAQS